MDPFHAQMRVQGPVAGGVVFALMPGTSIVFWPTDHSFFDSGWCRLPTESTTNVYPERVEIPAGRALFFRGDVVHAGAGYSTLNTRFHWYVKAGSAVDYNKRYDNIVRNWARRRGVVFAESLE